MKKIFVFLLFVLPLLSNAQDTQKAKNLLNEVTAKVKSYSTILIDFKYTVNNAKENINQESKGDVALKGNLFKLNIMGVTKLFDGVKNYTISPEDEEITISKHDDSDENAITPSKMLTFFNTGFKYSWDIQQNVKGRQIQFIKLIPTGAKDQRKEILLGIDVQTKHIYNLIEIGKNGTKTTLTITSFKVNQPLSKNNFIFEFTLLPPSGIYK